MSGPDGTTRRGLVIGGAQMSEKHCNFMINTGSATAADLENLGEEIRRRYGEAVEGFGAPRQRCRSPMAYRAMEHLLNRWGLSESP